MNRLKKFIGKPFVDGGRGPEGYDCWGLVKAVFREYGYVLEDYEISCFNTIMIDTEIRGHKEAQVDWLPIDEPIEPCLVTMRINEDHPQLIQHVGVYVGNNKFIHTLEKSGVHMVDINHRFYKNFIEGFYKWNR